MLVSCIKLNSFLNLFVQSQQAVTLSDAPLPMLKVRALVIFSILNSYIRRYSCMEVDMEAG